uniref:Reverse transcriptase domain-containing protein n=1 Tax=Oreochromis niloticus TaxID=8128 RepID=A0A669DKG7_ORENI
MAPLLKDMYNEAFSKCQLPKTLSEATICLILKKDKDPLLCSSYRPITLLNIDFKILSKILALRLQRVLPQIIASDQTGFMAGRHSYDNSRRLLNIIHTSCNSIPEFVVSLDAEKAFDRVDWSFLYEVMDRFGLGVDFILWVKLLYSSPSTCIRTNNNLFSPFPLERGTRQGCPLSPLLFAIAIEPLAIWLRSEDRFKGITRFGVTHKLSLYADDFLLYISDPLNPFPVLFNILDQYGTLSGYKLNYQKSELQPLNSLARALPHSIVPFKWTETGFRYLGGFISSSIPKMMRENFLSLLDNVGKDCDRWTSLPLSVAGRVNMIKMSVLPKFLYLFQHVPVLLTKAFFDKLEKILSHFIWGGKQARIRKSILQSSKTDSGLGLPNFRHYYWAANIQKLLHWVHNDPPVPAWVQMETASSCYSFSSILSSPLPFSPTLVGENPVAKETVTIWRQFRKYFGLLGPSLLTPLLKNCNFAPSNIDAAFRGWKDKGLRIVKDLYSQDTFLSFADLSSKYDLPNSNFFRYLQARDFVKTQFPHFPNRPPETNLDIILQTNPHQNRLISALYKILDTLVPKSISHTKLRWEEELQTTLPEQQWDSALKLIHSSSICARHALIQCKVVYKVHYTNAKLSKIYPTIIHTSCSRCGLSPANHVHMFWCCSKLSAFWRVIFDTLSQAYGQTVPPNPLSAIFGIPPDLNLSGPLKQALAFTTLLARRLILLKWKLPHPPTHDHWVRDVLFNLKLEKLRFSLKGSIRKFNKIWKSFLLLVDTITLLPESEVN